MTCEHLVELEKAIACDVHHDGVMGLHPGANPDARTFVPPAQGV
ncbi:MAG TPA: hypothetical protein PKZ76_05805 [Xanthomonadaceae bacterium]|nr:hypothetical protein [Xanthomonadaceae bacterium]